MQFKERQQSAKMSNGKVLFWIIVERRKEVFQFSEEFIAKKHQDANEAAAAYVQSLYDLLQCIDLSNESGVSKAHGILNMIEQMQKMHAALKKAEPSREERIQAFKRQ